MINLKKISRPSLILDEEKCRKNIRMMSRKAIASKVIFRPHFKTHQSPFIGKWFREEGVEAITVSSVTMAGHFAADGWNDITVAFPANSREIHEMKELSKKAFLNLLISSPEHLTVIKNEISFEAGCFLKVNTGMNRSGTDWDDRDQFIRMIGESRQSEHLRFRGFLTHAGHTYKARSEKEILAIGGESVDRLNSLRSLIPEEKVILSYGDTPFCSIAREFKGIDEIRPGNFVFYDLTQYRLGSCKADQIAVAVACPVVDKNTKRREIITYGGGVHLSKERLSLDDGRTVFGMAVFLTPDGWVFPDEEVWLRSISQEHGIISATEDFFKKVKIGDLIAIIPVHSCMTADLLRIYLTTEGRTINDFSPK